MLPGAGHPLRYRPRRPLLPLTCPVPCALCPVPCALCPLPLTCRVLCVYSRPLLPLTCPVLTAILTPLEPPGSRRRCSSSCLAFPCPALPCLALVPPALPLPWPALACSALLCLFLCCPYLSLHYPRSFLPAPHLIFSLSCFVTPYLPSPMP